MSRSGEPIRGKVARVLNNRELALNVGSENGVEVGMRFAILSQHGQKTHDPDTGDLLGEIPVTNAVVKIVRIEGPSLSTGRTFRTIPGAQGLATAFRGTPDRIETLRRAPDEHDSDEVIERTIGIGDPAVEAFGDEYDTI